METPKLGRAVAILVKDHKILLWWRFREDREYYVIPGGTQEEGETIEQTLEREVLEELNFKISNYSHIFDLENNYAHPRTDNYFIVRNFEGDIKMGAPELTHQSRQNIFRPEWVEFDKIESLPLMPEEGKAKLIEYLKGSNL